MIKSESFKFITKDNSKSINVVNGSESEYIETEEDIFMTKDKDSIRGSIFNRGGSTYAIRKQST